MSDTRRSIGDVAVTRLHLFRALVWLHVLIIGIPTAEFAVRGLTVGHQGFESLGWVTYLVAAAGASLLLQLAAIGIVVPIILADAALGLFLLFQLSSGVALFGFGFLLLAAIGAVMQGIVIREWLAART